MEQRRNSFRPTPIVFSSKEQEEDFERWLFSNEMTYTDKKNKQGVGLVTKVLEQSNKDKLQR